ncbi:MAG: efflux RND transporter periplasmic adaptor subunit [Patescibacteria group bacterium]
MLDFIKKRKALLIVVLALVVVGFVLAKVGSNGETETVSPMAEDLVRTVKISGKVIPKESVELGFETTGTVTNIYKNVGDTIRPGDLIARIDASSISAEILKAEAELSLALANLEKLDGAGVYEAQIENAKRQVIQNIINTRAVSDEVVFKKTDQLFIDPFSNNPEIVGDFSGYPNLRDSISDTRLLMTDTLDKWRSLVTGLSPSTYTDNHLNMSRKYLSEVSSYITKVSQAVNLFEETTWMSQSEIDDYRDIVVLAEESLNTASQNLISAEDKFKGLLLEVPVQVARVEAARATLANFRSQLSKTSIISPIDGVVSKQDGKIGQVVSANENLVSVISKSLEIEAFVPEILISGVRIGNSSDITLDAYSDKDVFKAKVVHIDPAETIRDGVSTYKVRLAFSLADERVRSGMTANIKIETFRKGGTRLIPEHAVFKEGEETFVYLLSSDGSEVKTAVVVGERDSSGRVELISDLSSESKLIINPEEE